VFTTSAASDSRNASQSILQMQGGAAGTELAAAGQSVDLSQTAIASSPAVGSSPPPDQTVDSTPPGVVWTDFPPTAPFLP
jgi:hypothetical protein